jgi:hypothetical protein
MTDPSVVAPFVTRMVVHPSPAVARKSNSNGRSSAVEGLLLFIETPPRQ